MDKKEREKRWVNGDGYNRYITEELQSFRKEAWKKQICSHFHGQTDLKILDVGTGPGFFACILSEEGHHVTGIDSSEGMLHYAQDNAKKLGVHPEFTKMDADEMNFPDDTFDVVISRNVTWTLVNPEKTYTEFKRILKPGGSLLIYDANWHLHFFDQEKMKCVRERECRHKEKYGTDEIVARDDMEYYKALPLSGELRPEWDRRILKDRLGMEVEIQEDIGEYVYEEWEKELYGESPLFEICAVKQEKGTVEENMKTYWQGRAHSFGFSKEKGGWKQYGEMIKNYVPEGRLKVLDVGTGTGVIAASMAALDYDVTAVDLCTNMIEKARQNLKTLGLSADFVCTPAGELPFDDDTFDIVVSRNVLWALPEPEKTLLQWQRVLKPGGVLAYWDANHYRYLFCEEDKKSRELMQQLCGSVHKDKKDDQIDYSLCDETAKDLPLSRINRPGEWDDSILPNLGFDIVAEEIYKPQVLLKYGITEGYYTHFFVAARNGKTEGKYRG